MDTGLSLLYALIQRYEYKALYDKDRAKIRSDVVTLTFPTLLQVLAHSTFFFFFFLSMILIMFFFFFFFFFLVQIGESLLGQEPTIEAWTVIYKIAKIAHSVLCHGNCLRYFLADSVFGPWFMWLSRVLVAPVPAQFVHLEDPDSATMTVFWKAKKWVVAIIQVRATLGSCSDITRYHFQEFCVLCRMSF